jgi:hypothetical protein
VSPAREPSHAGSAMVYGDDPMAIISLTTAGAVTTDAKAPIEVVQA